MGRWRHRIPIVRQEHAILALGCLNLLGAADQLYHGLAATGPFREVFANVLFLSGAGIALLYWGVTLPGTDIHRATYPRISSWSLGGAALLLLLVVFLSLEPGDSIVPSRETAEIAVAVGSMGGYIIGRNEARAATRAREAESHKRELEAHRSQLQRQNDRLDSFAGMLAHELRNPLQIAQMYHPQEQPRDEDAAEQVANAIDRIEEMVDILLVTVRGSQVNIDYEPVEIAEIATDAWTDLSTEVETATLIVDAEQVIQADPVHVEHLLRNLYRNSLEHGAEDATVRVGDLGDVSASSAEQSSADRSSGQRGGGTASNETASPSRSPREDEASGGSTDESVGVSSERNEDEARQGAKRTAGGFYIEDDGPGISEEIREDVTEAGFTTKSDGIGLGLTFVNQLAETYDWECTITSSESGGARFEFTDVGRVSKASERTR